MQSDGNYTYSPWSEAERAKKCGLAIIIDLRNWPAYRLYVFTYIDLKTGDSEAIITLLYSAPLWLWCFGHKRWDKIPDNFFWCFIISCEVIGAICCAGICCCHFFHRLPLNIDLYYNLSTKTQSSNLFIFHFSEVNVIILRLLCGIVWNTMKLKLYFLVLYQYAKHDFHWPTAQNQGTKIKYM